MVLRCQIRIEPARRRYTAAEQERLLDLFGTPERWGQTLRPMLWTHAVAVVPPFTGAAAVDLPVPCSFDFNLAATKYFGGLGRRRNSALLPLQRHDLLRGGGRGLAGDADFLGEGGVLTGCRRATWQGLMDHYYPNSAWLCLRKDVFDRLSRYKSRQGLPTWEQALERLLAAGEAAP